MTAVSANLLGGPLLAGRVDRRHLAAVQRRRQFPTRLMQTFQTLIQERLIRVALDPGAAFKPPALLRLPFLSRLPARLIAFESAGSAWRTEPRAWIGIRKRRLAPVVVRLYEDSEWSGIDLYLESLVKHGDALQVGFAS
ncbi:MAG: hypothetical protein V3T83_05660 [Acidobacteriota bacterium]